MNAGTPQNTNYLEPGAYRQNQILEGLGKRIAGFCATHWDINAMWLLREDLHSAKAFLGDGKSNGEPWHLMSYEFRMKPGEGSAPKPMMAKAGEDA